MSHRANFQKNYLMRYAVLAGVCLFLALWFGYDGLVGYPRQLKYARAYDELRELDSGERVERWRALAAERGWPNEIPEKEAAEIEDDITGQYFWGLLNLLFGVPALIYLLRSRGSWVESTEDGLKTSWGQSLRYADVRQLNKKKWAEKGIAKATYDSHGRQRVFVFDDFKYEREPLGHMLRQLESQLAPEQIVGGPPEADEPVPAAQESL